MRPQPKGVRMALTSRTKVEDELNRTHVESALTQVLRHGYGSLTIKVHGHRIAALDKTTRHTRSSQDDDDDDE